MFEKFDTTRECALLLDDHDKLRDFRKRFYLPEGKIYMDGNSLGLLSRDAEKALLNALEDFKNLGIDGWMDGSPPGSRWLKRLEKNRPSWWEQRKTK